MVLNAEILNGCKTVTFLTKCQANIETELLRIIFFPPKWIWIRKCLQSLWNPLLQLQFIELIPVTHFHSDTMFETAYKPVWTSNVKTVALKLCFFGFCSRLLKLCIMQDTGTIRKWKNCPHLHPDLRLLQWVPTPPPLWTNLMILTLHYNSYTITRHFTKPIYCTAMFIVKTPNSWTLLSHEQMWNTFSAFIFPQFISVSGPVSQWAVIEYPQNSTV